MCKAFPECVSRIFSAFLAGSILTCFASVCHAAPLQEIADCRFVKTEWADGDSFLIRTPEGKEHVVRLYYVDTIEKTVSTTSDKRRLREQARYFGVKDIRTVFEFGELAASFTEEQLSKPFTITTAFADARGRSGKPRYYAFIRTGDGKDLARLLVENGLARAFGVGRETPSGTPREEWEAYLDDLELAAAIERRGVWKHSDPKAIVAMRKQERDDMRELELIDDGPSSRPPESPIDVNTASLEDLMRAGLRESLADAVVKERPFSRVDDLIEINGIGPVTLKKIRPYLKVTQPAP